MPTHLRAMHSKLEIERQDCYTRYTGTREDLIAEGVASDDMFLEWSRRTKKQFSPGMVGEPAWKVAYKKGSRFAVTLWHADRESPLEPAPWNPADFKRGLSLQAGVMMNFFIQDATGRHE
jgi:hypothetical protein